MHTPREALIAILGISPNPDRYSYKAAAALKSKGYSHVFGVGPKKQGPEGLPACGSLQELPSEPLHTLTLYVGEPTSRPLEKDILAAKPKRIIFNPGAENPSLARAAEAQGIETVEGCTLVMLATGEF